LEHVLVALAADEEGVAGRVLRDAGADIEKLRAAVAWQRSQEGVIAPTEEYCAITLTGTAEAWTEQLNARAREGWTLVEIVSSKERQPRAVFRREPKS
nr:Clp protease N-terminal domain-containing protein [Actinomycetota bacterium]